jgi:hypothetical protein
MRLRWRDGAKDVEGLIESGKLQVVAGAKPDGGPWIARAERTISSAAAIAVEDPCSAYILAYDAARLACTALLIQQGLRPTTDGGHVAVERTVRAQFGEAFQPYRALRRRRHDLEYPALPEDYADTAEATEAIAQAKEMVVTAALLLPKLGPFRG